MLLYTDEFIAELINCEKEVVDSPGVLKEDRGNLKSNFTLRSIDSKFYFYGFIRQNKYFHENFSIGLDYNPKEERGTITLIRCNGPHGEHIVHPHHISCHIHKATAKRISQGLKPEGDIEITEEYVTLEDAIQFFVRYINIKLSDKGIHFPPPSGQINLFE